MRFADSTEFMGMLKEVANAANQVGTQTYTRPITLEDVASGSMVFTSATAQAGRRLAFYSMLRFREQLLKRASQQKSVPYRRCRTTLLAMTTG